MIGVSCLILGVAIGYFILKSALKKQSEKIVGDANKEAENIKEGVVSPYSYNYKERP